jgi:histidine ammonia-lyase
MKRRPPLDDAEKQLSLELLAAAFASLRDAADGGDADLGLLVDLAVRHPIAQVRHDAPAVGHRFEFRPGTAVRAAHAVIRESIPFMGFDRAMDGDVRAAVALVQDGQVLAAARRAVQDARLPR